MNEKRADRLSSIAQKAISDIIQYKVKSDKIGFVTVTAAKVTRDLSYCYVYVSILNDKNHEKFEALNKIKGFVRTELGHEVKLRKVPEIVFKLDESIENYRHIEELLEESKEK
ncbi:MAG: 30S ribosome-binding factor RbfA [Candidatus Caccosoma sp.]|nr:30S ribosome-binding factor RbfA [Candidatus Caccosoma sp.]